MISVLLAAFLAGSKLSAVPLSLATPALLPVGAAMTGPELFFEAGHTGQEDSVQFLARGRNFAFLLSPAQLQFSLTRSQPSEVAVSAGRDKLATPRLVEAASVRISFRDANAHASMAGEGELIGRVHYLTGGDPAQWRTGIPTYSKVRIEDLYPGISLVYYGNHQKLEYDFQVAPGSDPGVISLQFDGVDKVTLGETGDLVLQVKGHEIRQGKPLIYQLDGSSPQQVTGGYRICGTNTVAFTIGHYDSRRPLVIDPVLVYSTYFGGNGTDQALAVKVDGAGNIYFAGETLSTQFPFTIPAGGAQRSFGGGTYNGDAFVAKFDNTGKNLLYFTYLGGSAEDGALDLAVNSAGNAFLAGFTQSANFPTKNAISARIHGTADPTFGIYDADAFVAELSTNGSALIFSTYLGGTNSDIADGIALDGSNNVYVTGLTGSGDFPIRNALAGQNTLVGAQFDAFVTKITAGGGALAYSTHLGGTALNEGQGIAADTNGFAYVVGYTTSSDFPITTNAFQLLLNNTNGFSDSSDGFFTKLSPSGALVYSTYLGGSSNDYAYRITLDAAGNSYVVGPSISLDFPHADVPGLEHGGNSTNPAVSYDAFLTKFEPSGGVAYSTLFGGSSTEVALDVAVDPSGNAFIVGVSYSLNFPVTNVFDLFRATNSGGSDVFVTAINSNATAALYSAYLGGAAQDWGYGIAVDAESSAYIVGNTYSANFPVTVAPLQASLDGTSDAFLAKIRLTDPAVSVAAAGETLLLRWPGTAPEFVLESASGLTPPVNWTRVPQRAVLNRGSYTLTLPATNSAAVFRLRRP